MLKPMTPAQRRAIEDKIAATMPALPGCSRCDLTRSILGQLPEPCAHVTHPDTGERVPRWRLATGR